MRADEGTHEPLPDGTSPAAARFSVVLVHDYLKSETVDMVSDLRYTIQLPKSDVIQFVCMDNTVVTIRPSGTEPKIKYYFGVRDVLEKAEDLHKTETQLDRKIEALKALF